MSRTQSCIALKRSKFKCEPGKSYQTFKIKSFHVNVKRVLKEIDALYFSKQHPIRLLFEKKRKKKIKPAYIGHVVVPVIPWWRAIPIHIAVTRNIVGAIFFFPHEFHIDLLAFFGTLCSTSSFFFTGVLKRRR